MTDLADMAENCVLRRFGLAERLDGETIVKKMYDSRVEGGRSRGKPHRGWMDGVVSALSARGLTFEQGRVTVLDRPVWRRLINEV